MVKKKIDNRIRILIENGVKLGHRTMFIIIGDKARDQVPIIYDILTKCTVKARPTVLWCYKNKDEAISNHGRKRIKKIASGKIDINEADLFDTFRMSTTIHGRYYSDTYSILGRTYGVCVLQDFEALTPNLLARTIETVEGGGLIIILLKTITSLKQVYTMGMDVHKRFRTEAHQTITCRFNERLILSLADCKRCLVVNEELVILPLSSKIADVLPVNVAKIEKTEKDILLQEVTNGLRETPPAGPLVNLCKTYDQAKAVSQFVETLAEKQLRPPTSLTASRGRGKSAAMGLSVAAAVYFGYVNIYVTSPHPENLITFFEFILKGFDALEYQEHTDYTIIRSTNVEYKKAIIRINISRSSRQTIQYISPNDTHLLNAADLLIIDEAAAIPLPLVKKMLGPYIIFMASTINGYEGTGRALSLKLIAALQKGNNAPPPIKLEESIRYHEGDDIESWLMDLLCLDTNVVQNFNTGCPTPEACELYYIDRDALFSYHKAAESFLHRLVSIYTSAHYKNSPNDLQMMSDAPAHHLFCLLGPLHRTDQLPEIYVVIQVALEGQLSSQMINDSLGRGRKANGDLIPWNISEQYLDREFPKLAGARIVRIATHPSYQRMGYGKRAIRLLIDYYKKKFKNLNENIAQESNDNGFEDVEEKELSLLNEEIRPRKKIPVLLKRLSERIPEHINYLGTCNGLTQDLLKFWKCLQFVPVYLSQKANDLTGEHSCIMLHVLNNIQTDESSNSNWLHSYFYDFKRRILKLLGKSFRDFPVSLALSILENRCIKSRQEHLNKQTLDVYFLPHDLQRLDLYSRNQIEYRLILDLTTDISYLYFLDKTDVQLDTIQKAILLAIGIQGKSIDTIASELTITGTQVLAKFYDMLKKITKYFTEITEDHIENAIMKSTRPGMQREFEPIKISLDAELENDALRLSKMQKEELRKLKLENAKDFEIKGSDSDWTVALSDKQSKIKLLSVKSAAKRLSTDMDVTQHKEIYPKKKIKRKQNSGRV